MKKVRNDFPKKWKLLSLKDTGKIVSGGTPSTKEPSYWGDEIIWISPSDLTGYKEKYIKKGAKSITKEGLRKSSAKLMPRGSVLFSCRAPIGYTVIADCELCTNQGFKSVIPNSDINSVYLYYFLKNSKRQAEQVASGTTFKEISLSKFSELEIPIPPLSEQQAIVQKIEELFSELDKSIENLKTAQQQLKTYRQSVLKSAFEGKLTSKKEVENVMMVAEPNLEYGKDKFPKGWRFTNLGEVLKVSSGKGIKVNQLKGGNYPVYGGNGINGFHDNFFLDEEKLIIGRVGVKCGVTHITRKKSWVTDNALIVEPLIEDFDLKFFKLKLGFENLNKLSVSTAQPVISGSKIYAYKIAFPSLNEQKSIVSEIESRFSVADKLEESINQSLLQAETLRQSILKRAFEGKLLKSKI